MSIADYIPTDLVSQVLGGSVDVLKARYQSRVGGTADVQNDSLNSVDRQRDAQAKSQSYMERLTGGSFPVVPAVIMVAVIAVLFVVSRK